MLVLTGLFAVGEGTNLLNIKQHRKHYFMLKIPYNN